MNLETDIGSMREGHTQRCLCDSHKTVEPIDGQESALKQAFSQEPYAVPFASPGAAASLNVWESATLFSPTFLHLSVVSRAQAFTIRLVLTHSRGHVVYPFTSIFTARLW